MRVPLLLALLLFASPALAQFPPPGVYACFDAGGAAFGELTLLVAGDYAFTAADGASGSGQVASAGTDVNPLSGPLRELGLGGAFGTDDVPLHGARRARRHLRLRRHPDRQGPPRLFRLRKLPRLLSLH